MTDCVFKNEQIQQKDSCLSGENGDLPKEYWYVNMSVIGVCDVLESLIL
jgi:hypothetical protein